ncbi:MAG: MFS transporter [Desertimonas sp.]
MDRSPLSERDRRALVAVAVQFFANGAMTASFIARAPQIRDRIGVPLERFGLLVTLAAIIGLAASAIAGRIVDAVGTRRVLRVGAGVMVASLGVIGAADRPEVWLAGLMAYSFVDRLVDISMNLQGSWISARRRTPVMNRLHGLWSLGSFVGGLGAVAANAAGLSPFTHLGIVAVAMTVVLAFVGSNLLPVDEEGHADAEAIGPPARRPGRSRRGAMALLVAAGMFAVVAEIAGGDWATFRLADDFGATGAIASAAFVAFTVGMTAMRFGGDWLQQRIGRRATQRLSIALAAVGFVGATAVPAEAAAVVGFAIAGLGVATFMPLLYDDAARLPGRRGAGLGAMTAGIGIALLVTPVAVGALAGTSMSVGAAIAVLAMPALVGMAVVTESVDRLRRRGPAPG